MDSMTIKLALKNVYKQHWCWLKNHSQNLLSNLPCHNQFHHPDQLSTRPYWPLSQEPLQGSLRDQLNTKSARFKALATLPPKETILRPQVGSNVPREPYGMQMIRYHFDVSDPVGHMPQYNALSQRLNWNGTNKTHSAFSKLLDNWHKWRSRYSYHNRCHAVVGIHHTAQYGHAEAKEAIQMFPSWSSTVGFF